MGLTGQTYNFFRVLLEDIDFGRDIYFAVLPADTQDRVGVVEAEVLAVVEAVEVVAASRGPRSSSGSGRPVRPIRPGRRHDSLPDLLPSVAPCGGNRRGR